jgi:glycosyltransferase involved in cell wall biosynthesis
VTGGKTARVSVVAPCRNERGHIREFLENLLRQERDGLDCEFLIADGMSDDGTREILGEYAAKFQEIRVVENPGRIVSTGLNAAIRAARGEIVVRMDVHARYAEDFLKSAVAVLEETGAENVGGAIRAEAADYWGKAVAAAFHAPYVCGGAATRMPDFEGPTDTVFPGCWRKATLERIGLFDEALVRNQDDELNYRLNKAGGVVWQSPRIRCWYEPRNSLRKLFWQYFQYGFWKVAVIRKHRLPARLRHVVPGLFVLVLAALGAGWGVAAAAGWPASRWLGWLLAAQAGVYGVGALAAAVVAARRAGWELLPGILAAIPCFHFGYGLGFLAGLWHFGRNWPPKAAGGPAVVTRLTR